MTELVDKQAPLEDLMVAMDVVDTLRHQQDIVERELDAEERRKRLLARLKALYAAQGIEVPDSVLQEGIAALEQERFQYQPVAKSWRTKIATAWVSRGLWKKPIAALAVIGSLLGGVYYVSDVLPERELRNSLAGNLDKSYNSIVNNAKNPQIIEQAKSQIAIAKQAVADDDLKKAEKIQTELKVLNRRLQSYYTVRVISREGESSGVWRVPDVNTSSRNYYLIVEAIDRNNNVVELEILNEESNRKSMAKTWGIRVNEDTFYKVAADKNDDGIIQANQVGEKLQGYLLPKYSIATTGGAITKWN